MITRLLALCVIGVCMCRTSSDVSAADRVALVIGNGAYEHASKLPNATNDSTAIAKLLKGGGFEIVAADNGKTGGISDVGTEGFYGALERFKKAAAGAKVGLVYYSGHGMEVDGKNYLLPVDASLDSAAQLRTQAIPLDTILADMKATNLSAKMVILDSCRDNPLTRSWLNTRSGKRGMAELKEESLPEATMVMFSTAPGKTALDGTGSHSPFTKALLANLGVPGTNSFEAFLKVSDAVASETHENQVPWIRFDGAGRAFRLLTLQGNPVPGVESAPASLPATQHSRQLTEVEKVKFAPLAPGAHTYFKDVIKVGHSITGMVGDLHSQANVSTVFQDECKFEWKALQPDYIILGSSLKTQMGGDGLAFDVDKNAADDEKWQTSKSGRIYILLKKGIAKPFFTWQSAGISVNEIKPGADLEKPCWQFTYSGRFHEADSLEELRANILADRFHGTNFKFTIFVFAEK